MEDSRGKRPGTAELTPGGGLSGARAWVPGFFVSLFVWFGVLVLPLFLFFAGPGLAMLMAYTVMPWTDWAYPFLLMPSIPMLGILLTLAQIFVISVVFGRATRTRTRGEQFLLGIALFVVVMVVMKFLGPALGLSMPAVKM
jgi:hypothetical protein